MLRSDMGTPLMWNSQRKEKS